MKKSLLLLAVLLPALFVSCDNGSSGAAPPLLIGKVQFDNPKVFFLQANSWSEYDGELSYIDQNNEMRTVTYRDSNGNPIDSLSQIYYNGNNLEGVHIYPYSDDHFILSAGETYLVDKQSGSVALFDDGYLLDFWYNNNDYGDFEYLDHKRWRSNNYNYAGRFNLYRINSSNLSQITYQIVSPSIDDVLDFIVSDKDLILYRNNAVSKLIHQYGHLVYLDESYSCFWKNKNGDIQYFDKDNNAIITIAQDDSLNLVYTNHTGVTGIWAPYKVVNTRDYAVLVESDSLIRVSANGSSLPLTLPAGSRIECIETDPDSLYVSLTLDDGTPSLIKLSPGTDSSTPVSGSEDYAIKNLKLLDGGGFLFYGTDSQSGASVIGILEQSGTVKLLPVSSPDYTYRFIQAGNREAL
ncbi:MAG: hypothetical protein PQJ58_11975 [Spirochaetales bacterium]|nr:hypothetical protein [Spirochaetales bacterium]